MQPPAGIAGATACARKNPARTLSANRRSNVSSRTSRNGSGWLAPALTTSTSSAPARAATARAWPASVRSATATSACAPCARDRRPRRARGRPRCARRARPAAAPSAANADGDRRADAAAGAGDEHGAPGRLGRGGALGPAVPASARSSRRLGEALETVRRRERVALHVLGASAIAATAGATRARALLGEPLVGAGLEELADPQPAGVARGAQGREDVVGADRLVAVGDRRLGRRGTASRSCAAAARYPRAWPPRPGPRGARWRSGRRARSRPRRRRRPRSSRAPPTPRRATSAVGNVCSWRSTCSSTASPSARDVVISTAGEVGPCSAWPSRSSATSSGVGAVVGDDRDLGRAGEQVDADLAEELALGLGDVGVARADDDVGLGQALDAVGHRGQRLDAAEREDVVGARGVHRVAASPGGCPDPARGGAQAITRSTPATFGTTTVMNDDASIG